MQGNLQQIRAARFFKMLTVMIIVLATISSPLFGGYFDYIDGEYPLGFSDEFVTAITEKMQGIADDFNEEDAIALSGNQENFAKANNNANASTMLNGNLYTRTTIKTVAIGVGTSAGVVDPGGIATIADDLNEGKDLTTGAALNTLTLYASVDGASLPPEFTKNLLFDFKLGYFSNDTLIDNFTFDSFMIGGGGRYKIFTPANSSGVVAFRPITVGTGVYYVQTNMEVSVDDLHAATTDDLTGIKAEVNSDLSFAIENKSTTVPIELVSSARLFGFANVMAGTGCDIVMGETVVDLKADTSVTISHSTLPISPIKSPSLELKDSKTTENAQFFRYKLLLGLGFEAGAVTFDIPASYYPLDNGYAVSVVAGAAF